MYVANLCGQGVFRGRVVHGAMDREYGPDVVLVLPHAGEEFYTTMAFTARRNGGRLAVIVERGGAGAHLVVSANEKNGSGGSIAILLNPKALTLLPEGAWVDVDATSKQVVLDGREG